MTELPDQLPTPDPDPETAPAAPEPAPGPEPAESSRRDDGSPGPDPEPAAPEASLGQIGIWTPGPADIAKLAALLARVGIGRVPAPGDRYPAIVTSEPDSSGTFTVEVFGLDARHVARTEFGTWPGEFQAIA